MNIYVVIPTTLSSGERETSCPHGAKSLDVEVPAKCFIHLAPATLGSFMFWGTVGMIFPQVLCAFSFLCLEYSFTRCL